MPLLFLVEMLAQIYCAVHVVKTGRPYWWIYLIIFIPTLGCLIYFFAEIYPDWQADAKIKRSRRTAAEPGRVSARGIKELELNAEMTPSYKNKVDLAGAYANSGRFDEAISAYENCLGCAVKDEEAITEGLAEAYYFKGDLVKANQYLLRLMEVRSQRKGDDYELLLARTFEEMGQIDAALREYSEVVKKYNGEEARCRYALLLKKTGRLDEANEIFDQVLKEERISPKYYRKLQKKWFAAARRERVVV